MSSEESISREDKISQNLDSDRNNSKKPNGRRKKVSKGITPIVAATTYSDEIKSEAIAHYAKLDVENSKNIKRRKIACYCIYQAHIILKYENPDPIAIGLSLGLEKKHAKGSTSLNLKYREGYSPIEVKNTYQTIMFEYLTNNTSLIEEDIDDFINNLTAFLAKYPIFRTKQPRTVIAAFILHNISLYGYEIELNEISKDFNLAASTVRTMQNDIAKHNPK